MRTALLPLVLLFGIGAQPAPLPASGAAEPHRALLAGLPFLPPPHKAGHFSQAQPARDTSDPAAVRSLAIAAASALARTVPADPARGRNLAERWCARCHVIGADGPGRDIGPSFPQIARTRSDEGLKAWVSEPHPPMPDLDLSGRTVEDIAAYIRTLGDCETGC